MTWLLACLAFLAGNGGCAGVGSGGPVPAFQGPEAVLSAEWADLDAAVHFAARVHELAILRVHEPAPGDRTYELISIRDEPVLLRAKADPPPAGELDQTLRAIRLEVRSGLFGDEPGQRGLLRTLTARLEKLRQRD